MPGDDWEPGSGEDWSIVRWWRDHPRSGRLWTEVQIGYGGPGGWPNKGSHRRIDAVHLPGHPDPGITEWTRDGDELSEQARGVEVEIVEAKEVLNLDVIGQCLAGIDMFSRAYPGHGLLTATAIVRVVRGEPDPALAWVCHRQGIDLAVYNEATIKEMRKRGELTWLRLGPSRPGRRLPD